MDKPFIEDNTRERERLRKLVDELTDEELSLVIYKEGWTIAVVLAHLACWDQRRLVLMRKWKQKGKIPLGALEEDVYDIFNDTMLPFLLKIPPRKAANLSVHTAEKIDRELEKAPPALIAAIDATGYPLGLNRSVHRKMHLDEIEKFLKANNDKSSQ